MFLSAYPLVPVKAILPATKPVEMSGLTMYQATPAVLCGAGVVKVTAVPSAPHTLPFAYITCCIRVSFESRREMTSVPRLCAAVPTRSFQQPVVWTTPLVTSVVVSLRQWPWGVVVVGALPEPGWSALGGIAYPPTPRTVFVSVSEGVAESSDDVLVNAHRTIWLEV